jgi:hypothetical protein
MLSLKSPVVAAMDALAGRSVAEVLQEAQSAGIRIIFTDHLVPAELRVDQEPASRDPLEALREILHAHALALDEVDSGIYVVKREPREQVSPAARSVEPVTDLPEQAQVTASRYAIDMGSLSDPFALASPELQTQPALDNDAARAIRRFPGTAGNDFSARTHVRGGTTSENLILLDGVPLHDPFHLGSLPVAYSIIDPAVLGRAEFYSGVLPIEYDGYMSSMLSMQLRDPVDSFGGRASLSFLDASLLVSGRLPGEQNDWLLFSRRGLRGSRYDLVKPDIGRPDALDNLARVRFTRDDQSTVTLGVLAAHDRMFLSERSLGDFTNDESRHRYLWAAYEKHWNEVSSRTLLTYMSLESQRESNLYGYVSALDNSTASASDSRSSGAVALRQDWTMAWRGNSSLRWGLSATYDHAQLNYSRLATLPADIAAFFQHPLIDSVSADTRVSLQERQAYWGVNTPLSAQVTFDGGVHWVHRAYSTDQTDASWDPRFSLLFDASSATRLRLSWGRMSQTFAAIDLPVERNLLRFDASPDSTMQVLALEHEFSRGISVRAEIFNKHIDRPPPRLENVFVAEAFLPELRGDAYIVSPQASDARGFDFYLAARLTDRLSGWLTYSWSKATDEINGERVARAWDQRHALATGAAYENRGWLLSGALSAHSNWPLTPLEYVGPAPEGGSVTNAIDENLRLGARNSLREGFYFTLDLKAAKRFQLNPGSLQLSVDLSNATDRSNRCCDDPNFARISDQIGTQAFSRPRYWQPLRPYVGINWEF